MIYPPLSWSTSLLFSQGQGKEGVALAGSLISFTDSFLPAKGRGRLPRLAWHGFVPAAPDHRSDPPFRVILKGEVPPESQGEVGKLRQPDTAAGGAGRVPHAGAPALPRVAFSAPTPQRFSPTMCQLHGHLLQEAWRVRPRCCPHPHGLCCAPHRSPGRQSWPPHPALSAMADTGGVTMHPF